MGLNEPRTARWSASAVAFVAAISTLAGCSAAPSHEAEAFADASPAADSLDQRQQQALADSLVQQIPCADRDQWLDDLAFWDTMRGYDCVDGTDSSFVRVYAHSSSVAQVLAEWDETFIEGRTARRGTHWFVIGPAEVIGDIKSPPDDPEQPYRRGAPLGLTADQEYLTMCTQYALDEALRTIRMQPGSAPDAAQYDALFPGVGATVRTTVDRKVRNAVTVEGDEERWPALLSKLGPRFKSTYTRAASRFADLPTAVHDG